MVAREAKLDVFVGRGETMRAIIATLAVAILTFGVTAAQPPAPPKDVKAATGAMPAGWKARLDDVNATPDSVSVTAEQNSLAITTGPGGVFYKPGMKAEKDYQFVATFSQLKPSVPPQPYGLFVAGADLDKDVPRYTALLIRADGKYQIVSRTGTRMKTIVDWTVAPQMADPKGVKTSNTLSIRGLQGAVHFFVGEKEVHQMPRAKAGPDGIAGVRVGPKLSVQVNDLSVKKFP
jgi:hypothetical protein